MLVTETSGITRKLEEAKLQKEWKGENYALGTPLVSHLFHLKLLKQENLPAVTLQNEQNERFTKKHWRVKSMI